MSAADAQACRELQCYQLARQLHLLPALYDVFAHNTPAHVLFRSCLDRRAKRQARHVLLCLQRWLVQHHTVSSSQQQQQGDDDNSSSSVYVASAVTAVCSTVVSYMSFAHDDDDDAAQRRGDDATDADATPSSSSRRLFYVRPSHGDGTAAAAAAVVVEPQLFVRMVHTMPMNEETLNTYFGRYGQVSAALLQRVPLRATPLRESAVAAALMTSLLPHDNNNSSSSNSHDGDGEAELYVQDFVVTVDSHANARLAVERAFYKELLFIALHDGDGNGTRNAYTSDDLDALLLRGGSVCCSIADTPSRDTANKDDDGDGGVDNKNERATDARRKRARARRRRRDDTAARQRRRRHDRFAISSSSDDDDDDSNRTSASDDDDDDDDDDTRNRHKQDNDNDDDDACFVPDIVIDGFPYWCSEDEVRVLLQPHGRLDALHLSIDDLSGAFTGAVLVRMHTLDDALRLCDALHGSDYQHNPLTCGVLTPRLTIADVRTGEERTGGEDEHDDEHDGGAATVNDSATAAPHHTRHDVAHAVMPSSSARSASSVWQSVLRRHPRRSLVAPYDDEDERDHNSLQHNVSSSSSNNNNNNNNNSSSSAQTINNDGTTAEQSSEAMSLMRLATSMLLRLQHDEAVVLEQRALALCDESADALLHDARECEKSDTTQTSSGDDGGGCGCNAVYSPCEGNGNVGAAAAAPITTTTTAAMVLRLHACYILTAGSVTAMTHDRSPLYVELALHLARRAVHAQRNTMTAATLCVACLRAATTYAASEPAGAEALVHAAAATARDALAHVHARLSPCNVATTTMATAMANNDGSDGVQWLTLDDDVSYAARLCWVLAQLQHVRDARAYAAALLWHAQQQQQQPHYLALLLLAVLPAPDADDDDDAADMHMHALLHNNSGGSSSDNNNGSAMTRLLQCYGDDVVVLLLYAMYAPHLADALPRLMHALARLDALAAATRQHDTAAAASTPPVAATRTRTLKSLCKLAVPGECTLCNNNSNNGSNNGSNNNNNNNEAAVTTSSSSSSEACVHGLTTMAQQRRLLGHWALFAHVAMHWGVGSIADAACEAALHDVAIATIAPAARRAAANKTAASSAGAVGGATARHATASTAAAAAAVTTTFADADETRARRCGRALAAVLCVRARLLMATRLSHYVRAHAAVAVNSNRNGNNNDNNHTMTMLLRLQQVLGVPYSYNDDGNNDGGSLVRMHVAELQRQLHSMTATTTTTTHDEVVRNILALYAMHTTTTTTTSVAAVDTKVLSAVDEHVVWTSLTNALDVSAAHGEALLMQGVLSLLQSLHCNADAASDDCGDHTTRTRRRRSSCGGGCCTFDAMLVTEAATRLQVALQHAPHDASVHLCLGIVRELLGDDDGSLDAYAAASEYAAHAPRLPLERLAYLYM